MLGTSIVAVAALLLLASDAAEPSETTPMQKVISLLKDLKTEIGEAGKSEATSYDKFACFCKDFTDKKSTAVTEGQDKIDELSAEIQAKSAEKEEKVSELQKRQKKLEQLAKELADVKARCLKQRTDYEIKSADLNKAIGSLEDAIKVLKASKPAGAALLQSVRQSIQQSLALADALSLIDSSKRQAVVAFFQGGAAVDPEDPEYKFHSKNIIEVLEKLLVDFRTQKSDADAEWEKAKKICEDTKAALGDQISENEGAITDLKEGIDKLKTEIATANENLVNAESALKDDQLYLKDLTVRCEARAKDWDERTQLRAGELDALTQALKILEDDAKEINDEVNKRALLLAHAQHASKAKDVGVKMAQKNGTSPGDGHGAAHKVVEAGQALSFLQGPTSRTKAMTLIGKARAAVTTVEQKNKILILLTGEGKRLKSSLLASLAMRMSGDPFVKVKMLIQNLLERMLREAASEATKKGFCDEQLATARVDCDNRFADVKKLNAELAGLSAQKDALEEELDFLAKALKELNAALAKATTMRADEKAENLETIKKANEGLASLQDAIKVLKVYYKKAAKRESSKGTFLLQASPVEEDTPGVDYESGYSSKLDASKGIIGLLEVIQSDFERTSRKTEAAEKKALEDFVEFDRTSKSDIAGKEMQTALDEQDLEDTKNSITKKMGDLQSSMDMLDGSIKEIEELKPVCIDTGMSFAERVAKREEEIAALKKALELLAPAL